MQEMGQGAEEGHSHWRARAPSLGSPRASPAPGAPGSPRSPCTRPPHQKHTADRGKSAAEPGQGRRGKGKGQQAGARTRESAGIHPQKERGSGTGLWGGLTLAGCAGVCTNRRDPGGAPLGAPPQEALPGPLLSPARPPSKAHHHNDIERCPEQGGGGKHRGAKAGRDLRGPQPWACSATMAKAKAVQMLALAGQRSSWPKDSADPSPFPSIPFSHQAAAAFQRCVPAVAAVLRVAGRPGCQRGGPLALASCSEPACPSPYSQQKPQHRTHNKKQAGRAGKPDVRV